MSEEFKLSEKEFYCGSQGEDCVKSKDVKEFIRLLKEDNAEGIRMIIKMYSHKSGEELASEIIGYLNHKVMWRRAGKELIDNHSPKGLDKEVGSKETLSGNKISVYADNPTDKEPRNTPVDSGLPSSEGSGSDDVYENGENKE